MTAEKTLDLETAGTLLQACVDECWDARVDLEHTEANLGIGAAIAEGEGQPGPMKQAKFVLYVKTVSLKGSDALRSLADLADEHGLSIEGSGYFDSMVIR